jgi:hypothetical protein
MRSTQETDSQAVDGVSSGVWGKARTGRRSSPAWAGPEYKAHKKVTSATALIRNVTGV